MLAPCVLVSGKYGGFLFDAGVTVSVIVANSTVMITGR